MKTNLILTALFLAAVGGVEADNAWPHWRGPNWNGSTTAENLPVEFSRTRNIRWRVELPGPAASTPIIWGDYVLVSSTDAAAESLMALCFDRDSGKELWRHTVSDEYRKDDRSNYASSSPVTDGRHAIFFYGNGVMVGFDLSGKPLWKRDVEDDHGEFAFLWTFSSSPALIDGTLYLQVLQRDEPVRGLGRENAASYILAIDPATGKDLWQHIRPSQARAESREAFTSPIFHEYEGRRELLVAGGDCLTGHDLETGEELWRWGTWNPGRIGHWRLVTSPVAGDGIILVCAPKRAPIYAVRAGGTGRLGDEALAWTSRDERDLTSDVPTPLFYEGDFFILSDMRETLSRVEPRSGKVRWTRELPRQSRYRSSPTGADGKIWFMNHAGEVFVVRAEDGEILAVNAMGDDEDQIRASIPLVGDQLFVRTGKALFCIEK